MPPSASGRVLTAGRARVKLVAFDGDDTLWQPLSGVCLSDRTPTDDIGNPEFAYAPSGSPNLVEREDGALFKMRDEARDVLSRLREQGILTGVISYNHEGNVRRILEAFGVSSLISYVVAEWHTNKDEMLRTLISHAERDGVKLLPGDVLLIDDDPWNIYRGQCERLGAGFRCFGTDVQNLEEVLQLVH